MHLAVLSLSVTAQAKTTFNNEYRKNASFQESKEQIKKQNYAEAALFSAIIENADINIITHLAKEAKNGQDMALFFAAGYGNNPEIITALISAGADVNVTDSNTMTPLMMAAVNNANAGITTALIESGADIDAKDHINRTALMLATAHNPNPETTRALIKAGADVNAQDSKGRTALSGVSDHKDAPEIINILSKAGAKVN